MDFSPALERIRAMLRALVASFPNLLLGLLAFGAVLLVARALRSVVQRATQHHDRAKQLGLVLGRLVQGLAIALGILIAATIVIPSFTPAQLVSTLGVGSVAIGFAFRDILQNFLAGVLILLSQPFRIGDQIRFKDFEGVVQDIQVRATLLLTYDGRRVVVPNSELFTNSVQVNTAHEKRRSEQDIGLDYTDDLEVARSTILGSLRACADVLDDPPPTVQVFSFGDTSLTLRVRWWVAPTSQGHMLAVRDEALTAIQRDLKARGISLSSTFPTLRIERAALGSEGAPVPRSPGAEPL